MFICKFCDSIRNSKRSLAQHEIRCSQNPNRITPKNGMLGKKGSNQWIKAKQLGIDPPKISEETRKKWSKASSSRTLSDETKEKISKSRIKFLKENPDMVPYKLNHYSKGPSYPELYWQGILDSYGIEYTQEYRLSLYSLDFAILDKKIDIEIDGDQHYLDNRK